MKIASSPERESSFEAEVIDAKQNETAIILQEGWAMAREMKINMRHENQQDTIHRQQ